MKKRFSSILHSLSGRVQLVFGGLFLAILAILGTVIHFSMEQTLERRSEAELANTTELIYRMTEIYVDKAIQNYLRSIAEKTREMVAYHYGLFRSGVLDEAEAMGRVRAMMLDSGYGRIGDTGYLAGVNHRGVLVIHPRSEGVDAGKHAFMKEAIRKKNGFLSYMWKNVGETEPREKVGYLAYFEPWDLIIWASSYKSEFSSLIEIPDLAQRIRAIRIGKTGYPFILDSQGRFIVHPTLEGRNIQEIGDDRGRLYIQNILKRGEGIMRYPGEAGASGESAAKISYFKYYPEMDWIVVSTMSDREIDDSLGKVRNFSIGALVAACIAVSLVGSLVFTRMLRPVSRMKKVADAVSEGDLTRRIEVTTQDEIGELSTQFNAMLSNFNDVLQRVQSSVAVLLGAVQDLSVSAQEISTTSNQQAASVKEIVSTMEDSDKLTKSISTRITEVARIANTTRDAVSQGFGLIQESLTKMDEIKASNAERIAGVRSLSDKIENIWEIVNIINSIADQTKIIAFNAELEAASAGDAGKNFKIVAAEIRRLADSTVESTAEIKSAINEIQHSSDNLIIASEEGTEKIIEGWELSNRLRLVFEDIQSSSEISARSAEHIATSTDQQVAAFEQILQTLKQISEGIDNFVLSTRSTTEASQKLKGMADDLKQIVVTYVT
ncbi:MAG: methyl-accepting chemotaxis protein [Desulfococcaceae bacterium]